MLKTMGLKFGGYAIVINTIVVCNSPNLWKCYLIPAGTDDNQMNAMQISWVFLNFIL